MQSVSEKLQQALGHHQAGDVDRAETIYREIIRVDSRHADALHLLGVAAHQKKKHADAINLIGQAIEVNSAPASYHCNLGAAYRAVHQFEQAETCFRRAIHLAPNYAEAYFNLGNSLNDQKRFPEAAGCFRRFLKLKPNHALATFLLGVVSQALGDVPEAVSYFRTAVKLNPQDANAWAHLGSILHSKDQNEESERCFRNVVQLQPSGAAGHYQLGLVLQSQKKNEAALKALDSAVSLQPDFASAHGYRAMLLQQLGQSAGALQTCLIALELELSNAQVLYKIGNLLVESAVYGKAITCFQKALEINPNFAEAWTNLGGLFKSLQRFDESEHAFRRSWELTPNSAMAANNLGASCQEIGNLDEALELHQKALLLEPRNFSFLNNSAACLRSLGRLNQALAVSEQIVQNNPDDASVYNIRGSMLESLGRFEQAEQDYCKALGLFPNPNDLSNETVRLTHQNRSVIRLIQGKFDLGWPEYEWRSEIRAEIRAAMIHGSWSRSTFKNKTVLVHAEQGVGDEIMFASCLSELASVAAKCIVECDRRLLPIFRRSFPGIQFLMRPMVEDPAFVDVQEKIDLQIPIGSLPRFFRPNLESFPNRRQFLIPDDKLCKKWDRIFAELGTGLKVGISFRGGGKPRAKLQRSIPLQSWKKIFSVPDIHFINLQYGDVRRELAELKNQTGMVIHDFEEVDPLWDLDGMIAQISALDLVISVANSTVHLAGAVGRNAWSMLPAVPNWRWMLEKTETPWYPSVRLFRQQAEGEWGDVLHSVAERLSSLVSKN